MPIFYTAENTGVAAFPPLKPNSPSYGGKVKVFQATMTLAAQTTSDQFLLATAPIGYKFLCGILTSTVTLGTSVIAIGTNAVHASNGQYRAAATFTAVDTPTLFGVTATGVASATLAADANIWLTIATATLPGSGTLVCQLFYGHSH